MPRYEVLEPCYVPVANGVKFKQPGQVVTLDETDAADLDGYVRLVREPAGVQKLSTSVDEKPSKPSPVMSVEEVREKEGVNSDVGESNSVVQRATAKDRK